MAALRSRRTLRISLGTAFVLLLLGGIATSRWFLSPAADSPIQADAIVMLAGGRGERLELARALADDGLAPTLVIMNGTNWSKGREACAMAPDAYEVLCPANAENTRGEARVLGEVAELRGWDSIMLVTSDYHMHRAASLVGRCFEGNVNRQVAENTFDRSRLTRALVNEWAGTVHSWFVRRC